MLQGEQLIKRLYPEVFGESQLVQGQLTTETAVKLIEHNNLQMQIFQKVATNGSLIERDRLLEYTVGSYYNEINIYLAMNKQKEANNQKI